MIALLTSSPKNAVTLTRQRGVEVADPYNSPPPEISRRSTKLAALNQLLGTFARKLASLKQYGLVRLASQAVQPSQNIVAYRPWSGRYAPCFSPTSPRFIRHRRRFGDVAHLSQLAIEHCGAAIKGFIIEVNWSLAFILL